MNLELITHEDINFIYEVLQDPELLRLARGPNASSVSIESLEAEIASIPGAWWIMLDGERKIGWIRLTPISALQADIGIVIVDPEDRQKGIGELFCTYILQQIAIPLFREVYWHTWLYNHASLKLAAKLGFEPLMVEGEQISFILRSKKIDS